MIGTTELVLLSGLALLLFGGKKLPEMMRGLGQGVKEFKKGMKDTSEPEEKENDNRSPSNPIEEQIGDKSKEEQSDTIDDGKTKE
ncbi:MAG: twin-arginine translocase TatA/TatE family subunit [Alphaproteobacteria bacterium]|nr:twin-arginine translocase TatA/TatE family subunit [Alphaproteobacteria bacterium]